MQLGHAMVSLENAFNTQIRLGAEGLADIAEQLLEALRPAVRQTLMEVVEAAAGEISSQMRGQRVEIIIRDGDPDLVITDISPADSEISEEETLEARLTLRLPESLKSAIEDNADHAGESINSWVVSALRSKSMSHTGSSIKTTLEI